MDSGCQVLDFGFYPCGFRIPVAGFRILPLWIPDARCWISDSTTVDSRFHVLECGFYPCGFHTWILANGSRIRSLAGFQDLYSGFQCPVFRIPQAKLISWIPESGFNLHGAKLVPRTTKHASKDYVMLCQLVIEEIYNRELHAV